jgi:membrane-bound lytic murein transglycosylase
VKENELRKYFNNKIQEKSELLPKSPAYIIFSKKVFSSHRNISLF